MDTFMEKIVEKKKTPKDAAITLGIIVAALLATLVLMDIFLRYPQLTSIIPLLWPGRYTELFILSVPGISV